ncbi:hypothetical protein KZ829_27470 [Actinoplanes hulinensis]|uniref:Uncharacterized protein n=1 Tax=Actinoplanes hulinensis TaxID=1144547 RepID=A0ABS7B935_9ACTN|nr:hypothetical protein [Actinoplanes hulinensis]MBW6437478.1 hypothetical protein [Actinoplanes hulinensis]
MTRLDEFFGSRGRLPVQMGPAEAARIFARRVALLLCGFGGFAVVMGLGGWLTALANGGHRGAAWVAGGAVVALLGSALASRLWWRGGHRLSAARGSATETWVAAPSKRSGHLFLTAFAVISAILVTNVAAVIVATLPSDKRRLDPIGATVGPTTPEPIVQTPVDPRSQALATLETIAARDRANITLSGQFVAQLSSRYTGMKDPQSKNGTFEAPDILGEYWSLYFAHGSGTHRVLLLKSTDFGTRRLVKGKPLWVVFVAADFRDRKAVLDWCSTASSNLSGTELDKCEARTLQPPE